VRHELGQVRLEALQLVNADLRRAALAHPNAVRAAIEELEDRRWPAEALCVSPLPTPQRSSPWPRRRRRISTPHPQVGVVGTAAAVGRVLPAMRAAARGTLLFTTGSAAVTPTPARSVCLRMLHDELGDEGDYALHTVIVGPIGVNRHDPAGIAQAMWEAAERRTDPQILIR
jgi:hypothetical protein